ncbi:MAG TPA: LacI family DNA-binding transcriptional regulator [Usitatibacteraceae bacterium]|nr:LacI family DNA-binding transcriptional regulator [Usitatibacteraceae bacterium]
MARTRSARKQPRKPRRGSVQSTARAASGKAVTIRDVAKVAGVSPITVSRALSRPELVTPETLERIRAVVSRTGYVRNVMAGSLRSRRSRIIAAVFPQVANTMFVDTIQALMDRLRQDGYQVLLGLSSYQMREDELIAGILGRQPEGIFLTGISHAPETRRRLIASHIPVVEAWDLTPTPIDMLVGFSHEKVGAAMARHLLGKGHREIGLVWSTDIRAGMRRQGFLSVLAENGITQAPTSLRPAPATFQRGREGLAELLGSGARVSAVACGSDTLAQGVIAEAQDRGIRIPGDIAVMGFGNLDFAAHTTPALTTIGIDKAAIGRLAAEALIARIEGREVREKIVDVGFELIEREST